MAGMTIELSKYVIDAIADAIVKKMQEPKTDVLDKIKADVEEQVVPRSVYTDKQKKQVLEIIDKYRGKQNE